MNVNVRFATIASLLLATALLLHARNDRELIPARQSFASFPNQLDNWVGSDIPIGKDVLDVLGPGDFLLRAFQDQTHRYPLVYLFLAYFPSQRAGDTIHSPKHCLPGAGWLPIASSRITLSLPRQAPFPANRYVIAKGGERQLVIYWYWAHNRGIASEYWAKFYLVADSMRMNRSDGSLIRLTTPIGDGETADAAQERLLSVADNLFPTMDQYIPK